MIPKFTPDSFYQISPFLFLAILGSLSLIIEVFWKEKGRIVNGIICALGLVCTGGLVLFLAQNPSEQITEPFAFSLVTDFFSLFCFLIFLLAAFISILLQLIHEEIRCGEAYGLTLFAVLGMLFMVSGLDLITIFIGLEVMSLSLYALVGLKRTDLLSNEAALKYFLLGAFSSGVFLYGIALIYGATGSVYLSSIASEVNTQGPSVILLTGMVLLIAGFAFKAGIVPFHMWVPDVYEGAPTSITSLMATGVKAAAFASFLRIFYVAFADLQSYWSCIFWILSVLTMTLGNLMALVQKSLKRMLAYSSIAHAGYIMIGFTVLKSDIDSVAPSAILYYLLTYTLMTAGAFSILFVLELGQDGEDRKRFAGLGWRRPFLGAAMTLFLLSLAGIPPTAGFMAKFYIFSASIREGFYGLTIIAILNSLISLYYYLKPLVWMYMVEGESVPKLRYPLLTAVIFVILFITVLGTLLLGIFPANSLHWTQVARDSFSSSPF